MGVEGTRELYSETSEPDLQYSQTCSASPTSHICDRLWEKGPFVAKFN